MTITNIYLIENLADLSCDYRLYGVRGISSSSPEYEKNRQKLVDTLSVKSRSPCALHSVDGQMYIAQPVGYSDLPEEVQLVRAQAILTKVDGTRKLDFNKLTKSDIHLAIRFLQFSLQDPLFRSTGLWQPGAGLPFYHKIPDSEFAKLSSEVHLYKGFKFRLDVLSNNQIGIAVDTSSKYVSRRYLPVKISDEEFHRIKGRKCLYEFGNSWYEIRIEGLEELTIDEIKLPNGRTLYEEVQQQGLGLGSHRLLSLPKDCSALAYYTKLGELRRVPSALCRFTYKTNHPSIRRLHGRTISQPDIKTQEIEFVVKNYLRGLEFGGITINFSSEPIKTPTKKFSVPDLLFGNGITLTTRRDSPGVHSPLQEFGSMKRKLLSSAEAGFYSRKSLGRQYFIMPRSVFDSYGREFLKDLQMQFADLYGANSGEKYDPTIITYDDSVPASISSLGREIIKAVEMNFIFAGYGLVMIPRLSHTGDKEDELANLLMRELRKRQVYVSVIHTEVTSESYVHQQATGGQSYWIRTSDAWANRRFKGYVYNVVLNKILLANSYWPFVLLSQLHADLTIGIDVKNNMAGFTFIYGDGRTFRFFSSDSEQSEQLTREHMTTRIFDFITEEQGFLPRPLKNIVIHRDGMLYPAEIQGINAALKMLAEKGKICPDYDCSFVDIKKTSRFPVRFFETEVDEGSQRDVITNPVIGTCEILGNDAFLATTGEPYRFPGTSNLLHITKISGGMRFEDILEDIFHLSNLTWTRIDFCLRVPISLKMTDIRLREIAGEYDQDALRFDKEGTSDD